MPHFRPLRVNGQPVDAELRWTEFGDLVQLNIGAGVTAIEASMSGTPTAFALRQNFPNPFNPETTIAYELPREAMVVLTVFSPTGQKVRDLVSDTQGAGYYKLDWDGLDDAGRAVSSGMYLCRLQAGEFVQTRKLVLVR